MAKDLLFKVLPVGIAAVLLVGCGGHGLSLSGGVGSSSSLSPRATVKPVVNLHWATRSRSVNGPSSALSAAILFQNPTLTATVGSFTVDRATAPAGYTQAYTSPTSLAPGAYVLSVVFHAGAGGTGEVVAVAQASVLVTSTGQVTNANKKTLSVDATSNLSSVSVYPYQTLSVGKATTVAVMGTDLAGNMFPLTPGSVFLHMVSGSEFAKIQNNSDLVGINPGVVSVTATVDGRTSPAATLSVAPPLVAARMMKLATNRLVVNPQSGKIYASVPSTGGSNGNKVVEIDPVAGKVLRATYVGSEPNALGLSDDGTTLYIGLNGSSSVQTLNTTTFKVGTPFSLGKDADGSVPVDIAVQPGNPNVVAISRGDTTDSGVYGPKIYDHGVARSKMLGLYSGTSLAWPTADTLYAYDNYTTLFDLDKVRVDANGATITAEYSGRFSGFGTIIKTFGSALYGSDGSVVSTIDATKLGTFAGGGLDLTVDVAKKHAYLAHLPGDGTALLNVFQTTTYTPFTSFVVPGVVDSVSTHINGLARWGDKGLVFRTGTQVVFIDNAPGL